MRILVVDNFDSFVYNLVQYLGELGAETTVWRNDDARLRDPAAAIAEFHGVLLSPGPGTPARAGATLELIGACAAARLPVLGVCLGHQAIGEYFGGTIDRADELLHGKTSQVRHDGTGVLAGIPSPFVATRYHSLTVLPDSVPDALLVTARTESGMIMAMRHRVLPIHGVQYHPESVMTEGGHRLLATWLGLCGQAPAPALVDRLEERTAQTRGAAAGN